MRSEDTGLQALVQAGSERETYLPKERWHESAGKHGATVRCNAKLRHMNVVVSASDERSIEVLASGPPFHHGAQLAIDVTLRSAFINCGSAIPGAAKEDGAALARARPDKERKYAELLEGDRCHLVVVALETGGRWSAEALEFVGISGGSAGAGGSIDLEAVRTPRLGTQVGVACCR